jgi:hypothetical protein
VSGDGRAMVSEVSNVSVGARLRTRILRGKVRCRRGRHHEGNGDSNRRQKTQHSLMSGRIENVVAEAEV